MPRSPRVDEPGIVYHAINRGNGRMRLFHKDADFDAFERVLGEGLAKYPVDLLTYCLMGNHWHLVLSPREAGALSGLMRWVGVTHVRRHHEHYHSRGGGHLYQGRFRSFPVEADGHLLRVCRYVEANPLRAKLVDRAQDWRWSGLFARANAGKPLQLAPWPVERPRRWTSLVNEPMVAEELEAIRTLHVNRGRPMGSVAWTERVARVLSLGSTLRRVGRPAKARAGAGNQ